MLFSPQNVRFDDDQQTPVFKVRQTPVFKVLPGGTIKLFSNTQSAPSNKSFDAILKNVDTNNSNGKVVSVGKDTTTWTNIRAGRYVINFRDDKDRIFVTGNIKVNYTS